MPENSVVRPVLLNDEGKPTKIKRGDKIYFERRSMSVIISRQKSTFQNGGNLRFDHSDDKIYLGAKIDVLGARNIASLIAGSAGSKGLGLKNIEFDPADYTYAAEFC